MLVRDLVEKVDPVYTERVKFLILKMMRIWMLLNMLICMKMIIK